MAYYRNAQTRDRRWLGALLLLLLLVSLAIFAWSRQPLSSINLIRDRSTSPTGPVPSGSTTVSSTGSSKGAASGEPAPAAPAAIQPTTPSGQFVSNHQPDLSGQPYPNSETSTCTTTPGATCTIAFTMGSVSKSLPVKRTDADGNATWSHWTLQSIGLTEGTWHITAIAANGSKTASAYDANDLRVGP